MRIPSGDLSPARRRRYGGGYAQRRRRMVRLLLALVVLLAVAAVAYYLLHRNDTNMPVRRGAPAVQVTPTSCPTTLATAPPAAPSLVLPAATSVRLEVLNGTPRNLLGRTVGDQLAARGFMVTVAGNAPKPQVGASSVVFGPGAQPGGTLVARTILGATLSGNARAAKGSISVVLGSGFARLRTPAEVAALSTAAPPVQPTRAAPVCP